MARKPAVIAYDIVSNKRRRKVFHCLQTWGLDAQYSVFECDLTWRQAEELFVQLSEIIDNDEDTLMLAWMDNLRKVMPLTEETKIHFRQPMRYLG
ncbi:MAG: CRISPR-associated endonuclease Cas2 [Gammaproteobacteria bacterium]|nr:CRISPR-associated endonuclease Cas2 [Gammaproteobacteria bacterium]